MKHLIHQGAILKDLENGDIFNVVSITDKMVHYEGENGEGKIILSEIDKVFEVQPPALENSQQIVVQDQDSIRQATAKEKEVEETEKVIDQPAATENSIRPATGATVSQQSAVDTIKQVLTTADKPTPSPQVQQQNDQARRLLGGRFIRDDQGNYRRPYEEKISMVDEADRIRFVDRQLDTFQAAVELAKIKGWEAIEVTGSDRFRADAWYSAKMAGLEVQGYTPTEKDLKRFEGAKQKAEQLTAVFTPEMLESKQSAENFALENHGGVVGVNEQSGRYLGKLTHETSHHVVQAVGRGAVVHDKDKFDKRELSTALSVNSNYRINYADGKAKLENHQKDHGQSMSL